MLEARLRKVDGILWAKVRGFGREEKFYYNVQIAEEKTVLPSTIKQMLEALKKETNGDEDFTYGGFELTALSGTVEKTGEDWGLVARSSKQKYALVPNDALKKLVEVGHSQVTVGGRLSDEDGRIKIEVSSANESAK